MNRAFAVARADGAAAGLALLDDARADVDALPQAYPQLVRGTLLSELGRHDEARASFEAARAHARNAAERRDIERALSAASARHDGG